MIFVKQAFTQIVALLLAVPLASTALAQSSSDTAAHSTAGGEQTQNYMMGATSAGAGGVTMKMECPQVHTSAGTNAWAAFMCYVAGPGMIAAGIADVAAGRGRQGSIDATGGYTTSTGGGDVGGFGTGTVPDFVSSELQNAIDTAKSMGVDPTNPDSLAAAKSKADSMGAGDMGNSGAGGMPSDPELQAALDAKKKEIMDKFKVTGVGFEGGSKALARHGSDNFDLGGFLNGLKDGDRGPASVDGLQKTFNGEPIGVAADNIFKQITRRYQAKIQANTFLSEVPAKTMSQKLQHKK